MTRNILSARPGSIERSPPSDIAPDAAETRASHPGNLDGAEFEPNRAARPILGIIIASVVIYLARVVLLPIAMAGILALISSPLVNRLEAYVGRVVSAVAVVLITVVTLTSLGYFFAFELTSVAVDLTAYTDNVARKLSVLEKSTPDWLRRVEEAVKDVEQQLEKGTRQPKAARQTVTETSSGASMESMLRPVRPLFEGVADFLIIVALLFFFLYERKALRARFVRLAARARIAIAAEAIDTAGEVVSHYLLLYSMLNLGFGIAVGLITLFFGLPYPWFWGLLAFILRFVPYVGATASALLPTLVAFAVSPGWGTAFEVLGSFIVMDQLLAQFIEPIFIGHGIGVSSVALLVSALYWAWLWGPAGLLLSVPLTVCLKVSGDFIPALNFFSVLLGAEPSGEGQHEMYRRLLERDEKGALDLAICYSDENGLEAAFDNLLIPLILLAGEERRQDHISVESGEYIFDAMRKTIPILGARLSSMRSGPATRVIGVCAPNEPHVFGLMMLLEVLRRDGAIVRLITGDTDVREMREAIRRFSPHLLCITCTVHERLGGALELISLLKSEFPSLTIIAGGEATIPETSKLLRAGCRQIFRDRKQAVTFWRRSRSTLASAAVAAARA
jgi:predicted PurR-regulated permease PerM